MGVTLKKPVGEAGATWPAICIGLFIAFGGVLFGYDTGTISGILGMEYFLNSFGTDGEISGSRESLIVSILSAGTFIGALASPALADTIGRRWGLFCSCAFVFNLGVILQTAATEQPMFIAGRFFAGLGVGLLSAIVPLYQSETAPKWIRGTIVGTYQLAITIGLFLAACVNYSTQNRNDSGSYRIPVAVQFAWSLIICGGLLFLPETPRFLIKKDRHEKAAQSLAKLRRLAVDHPAVVEELAEIEANHRYEMSIGTASYLECLKGTVGKRLITGMLLQGLQQLTGVNFIFYYGTQYFQRAGFQNNPFIIQVITNVVNVCSTFPGLYLVEKLGRRNLLLLGAVGMGVCQYVCSIIGVAAGLDNLAAQRASIAFVCIYIFFFASTWGPVAWVVTGELFPLKVRAKCLSITTATNWLLNFIIAFITPYFMAPEYADLGSNVFWIWGSFCWICVVFVWFMIYETKGLSLEQVDELYGTCTKAWQSMRFRPQVSFQEVEDVGGGKRNLSIAEAAEEVHRKKSLTHEEKI